MEIFDVEPHTLWLPNEIMDKEEITFVLLAYYIPIASPTLRRAVLPKSSAIISHRICIHRRCLHKHVENDVSGTF